MTLTPPHGIKYHTKAYIQAIFESLKHLATSRLAATVSEPT